MTDQQQHTRLVADKFYSVGFMTDRFKTSVHISLSNRKVSKIEIDTFLDQEFEGCSFIVEQVYNGVEVTVE
jgi:hypothetical protein